MTGIMSHSHSYPDLFLQSAELLWKVLWGQDVRIGECMQCSGIRVIRYPGDILLLHLYVDATYEAPQARDRLIAYLEAGSGRARPPLNVEERYPWSRQTPVW